MDRIVVGLLAGALVLSAFAFSDGQSLPGPSITGKVVDEATGEPLEFVNVFVANTTSGTSTGTDGTYTLSNIRPGPLSGRRVAGRTLSHDRPGGSRFGRLFPV